MVELRSPKPSMGVRIPLPLPKNLSQFMAEIFYVKFAKFDYHAQSNAKCYHSPILHWRYHVTQWHKQQIWMIIFKLVHNWTQFKNMIVASQHDNLPYGKHYGYNSEQYHSHNKLSKCVIANIVTKNTARLCGVFLLNLKFMP